MSSRLTLLATISFVALGLLLGSQTVSATDLKPSIILIMVADLGYADISPYGQRKILTPNLAKLAERGMTFTQFYAGVSVCAPSRSSLMEGLHTGHTFIRGNKQNDPVGGQWPIPEDTVTIAKVLKEAGYATGMRFNAGIAADAPIQLFNLADDLGETQDVAAKHPDVVMRMAEIMSAEHTPSEIFPFQREE